MQYQDVVFTLVDNDFALKTTANALLDSTAGLNAIHNKGTYTNISITKITGSGTNAKATVVLSETGVTSVTITERGSGYVKDDNVKITAASLTGSGRVVDFGFTLGTLYNNSACTL